MGDEAIIKYLYTVKADPNVYDHIDRSPLHVAAEQGILSNSLAFISVARIACFD